MPRHPHASPPFYLNLAPSVSAVISIRQSLFPQSAPLSLACSFSPTPHFSDADTTHPTQRPSPPQIPTSNPLFQNPAHTAPLGSNRTLSVVQVFIQALLPILLVHLTDRDRGLAALPNCLHNPLPCALAVTSHSRRWVHPPR